MSECMQDLSRMLRIKISASTTYHPQTDGQMEQINQEVEHFLQMFCNYPAGSLGGMAVIGRICLQPHLATSQHTPFMVETGCNPWMGLNPSERPRSRRSQTLWIR